METRVERAAEAMAQGFNCSQAVFITYSDLLGIEDQAMAARISSGFGGGFGRRQEVCGAASGGVMLVGLKLGVSDPRDKEGKERLYQAVRDFLKDFEDGVGHLLCRDIVGCNLLTEEGAKEFRERNLSSTVCRDSVRTAASIIERMLFPHR